MALHSTETIAASVPQQHDQVHMPHHSFCSPAKKAVGIHRVLRGGSPGSPKVLQKEDRYAILHVPGKGKEEDSTVRRNF